MLAFLLILLAPQDDVAALIDRLGSDSTPVREEAEIQLKRPSRILSRERGGR